MQNNEPVYGGIVPAIQLLPLLNAELVKARRQRYEELKAEFLAYKHSSYTPKEIEERLVDIANECGLLCD